MRARRFVINNQQRRLGDERSGDRMPGIRSPPEVRPQLLRLANFHATTSSQRLLDDLPPIPAFTMRRPCILRSASASLVATVSRASTVALA